MNYLCDTNIKEKQFWKNDANNLNAYQAELASNDDHFKVAYYPPKTIKIS